jgi:hypothetical protein
MIMLKLIFLIFVSFSSIVSTYGSGTYSAPAEYPDEEQYADDYDRRRDEENTDDLNRDEREYREDEKTGYRNDRRDEYNENEEYENERRNRREREEERDEDEYADSEETREEYEKSFEQQEKENIEAIVDENVDIQEIEYKIDQDDRLFYSDVPDARDKAIELNIQKQKIDIRHEIKKQQEMEEVEQINPCEGNPNSAQCILLQSYHYIKNQIKEVYRYIAHLRRKKWKMLDE